jgi:hypothetical protein
MAFPATYNINYYRGDTYDFIINPKDPNGQPFDLTNFDSALFVISTDRGDAGISVGSGSATIDLANDRIICEIVSSLGSQLSGSSYVYDVEIIDNSSSTVYTLLTGTISVTQDIARTGQA